ncbi:MAG TPA: hypothetical protein VGH65_10795 [Verrucomicrobiaceae bacterium]|jgi:hypothetical protein
MSESDSPPPLPPPLPGPQTATVRGPWIAWIIASTLGPALPFLLAGRKGLDEGMALIPVALSAQLICSIVLAVRMRGKLKKGPGYVVMMTFVFMIASVMVGTAAFFAACLVAQPHMDFR